MAEVLTQRQNELCTVKEKIKSLKEQREIILSNEGLKKECKTDKAEAAVSYFDTKIFSNRETYQSKLDTIGKEYDAKRSILEARRQQIDMEIEKLQTNCERKKDEAERTYKNYEEYLKAGMMTKQSEIDRANTIKSASTLALDKQIRELEKTEAFTESIVNMCVAQLKSRDAPVVDKNWVNPWPMPWDPEEAELARLRADVLKEAADRKKERECPYGPYALAYRAHA
jgi:hypothetical protein